jgi:hypothetical protein
MRAVEERQKEAPSDVISLTAAAALAHNAATGHISDDPALLDQVARVIAERTRVFARRPREPDYRLVLPAEIAQGFIEGGGKYLSFPDQRPNLEELAIRRTALPALLLALADVLKRY